MNELEILSIHFVATLLMVGIIWFVQLVHYPLMLYVRAADFRRYSQVNLSLPKTRFGWRRGLSGRQ